MFSEGIKRDQLQEWIKQTYKKEYFYGGKGASNLSKPKMKFFKKSKFTFM